MAGNCQASGMSSEKTQAIVIRVIEFSETSCVVTMFSRDFGKITALAKGARRPKSPFESAIDLLAIIRIVFLHKSTDTLDLLTEAKLERRFRAAEHNLFRLYAGYYVAELLREMTDTGDPHPELFDAALATLGQIEHSERLGAIVLQFEITALRLLGHLPSLEHCVGCGTSMDSGGTMAFGMLAGGVLCSGCRRGQRQVVRVTGATIELLRQYAAASDVATAPAITDTKLRGETRGILNQYMNNLLGRRPRMQPYLGFLVDSLY
jgi:DNA repair protein RecO (recombination protein O)